MTSLFRNLSRSETAIYLFFMAGLLTRKNIGEAFSSKIVSPL